MMAPTDRIQRKIGFEIEIPVLLSEEVKTTNGGTKTVPPPSGAGLAKFMGGDVIVKADKDTTLSPLVLGCIQMIHLISRGPKQPAVSALSALNHLFDPEH